MATKAEQFRSQEMSQHRTAKKKASRVPKAARVTEAVSPARSSGAAVTKDDPNLGATALRNLKTSKSRKKSGPALEGSDNGTPSRKSTRGSSGHVKLATNLQRRQIRRVHSPKARAARAAAH